MTFAQVGAKDAKRVPLRGYETKNWLVPEGVQAGALRAWIAPCRSPHCNASRLSEPYQAVLARKL